MAKYLGRFQMVIDAPLSSMWAIASNLELSAQLMGNSSEFERLDGGTFEVGTRWREVRIVGRQPVPLHIQIVELTPHRHHALISETSFMEIRVDTYYFARGDFTELRVIASALPTAIQDFLPIRALLFGKRMMRPLLASIRKDYEALAEVAELRGGIRDD